MKPANTPTRVKIVSLDFDVFCGLESVSLSFFSSLDGVCSKEGVSENAIHTTDEYGSRWFSSKIEKSEYHSVQHCEW